MQSKRTTRNMLQSINVYDLIPSQDNLFNSQLSSMSMNNFITSQQSGGRNEPSGEMGISMIRRTKDKDKTAKPGGMKLRRTESFDEINWLIVYSFIRKLNVCICWPSIWWLFKIYNFLRFRELTIFIFIFLVFSIWWPESYGVINIESVIILFITVFLFAWTAHFEVSTGHYLRLAMHYQSFLFILWISVITWK